METPDPFAEAAPGADDDPFAEVATEAGDTGPPAPAEEPPAPVEQPPAPAEEPPAPQEQPTPAEEPAATPAGEPPIVDREGATQPPAPPVEPEAAAQPPQEPQQPQETPQAASQPPQQPQEDDQAQQQSQEGEGAKGKLRLYKVLVPGETKGTWVEVDLKGKSEDGSLPEGVNVTIENDEAWLVCRNNEHAFRLAYAVLGRPTDGAMIWPVSFGSFKPKMVKPKQRQPEREQLDIS